jgi:hypothetical protein
MNRVMPHFDFHTEALTSVYCATPGIGMWAAAKTNPAIGAQTRICQKGYEIGKCFRCQNGRQIATTTSSQKPKAGR